MTAVEKNSKLINEENELALHSEIIAGDKITTISFLEQDNAIIDKNCIFTCKMCRNVLFNDKDNFDNTK